MTDLETSPSVLFVDLNNSALFPALAIGYLVATLRQAKFEVEVFSPLSQGVPGFERDLPDTWRDHIKRRLYFSTHPAVMQLHDAMTRAYKQKKAAPHPKLIEGFRASIQRHRPALILISAYLDHRPSVEAIGRIAEEEGIPTLLGGPVFNHPKIAEAWNRIPGVTHLFGGEADQQLVDICRTMASGQTPTQTGIYHHGEPFSAPQLQSLDDLPLPDFSDFPWRLYPTRVLTIMTGRGCEWGRCTFCSDVVTANGRGFRTRPLESVLGEIAALSKLYDTKNTFFLDIKLNSDLQMWRGLVENYQSVAPGGKWIGTVHVAARGDNGLDRDTLIAAKRSGMARISFGLESGSESLNRQMGKGTSIEQNISFMENAKSAGLSVRTSMMLGYPGETVADVELTAAFLQTHGYLLDRVRLSRFKAIPGTRFERLHARFPKRFENLAGFKWRYGEGRADYSYLPARSRAYRQAKADVLQRVFEINRKPLPEEAAAFNGLM